MMTLSKTGTPATTATNTERIMMPTKEYDFGVYGAEPDEMRLTAYTMYLDFQGDVSTNYNNEFITLELNRFEDEDTIEWLVGLGQPQYPTFYEDYLYNDYTDYDNWLLEKDLLIESTPTKILEWVKSLPEYEMIDQTKLKEKN
jgi:hypothetical protein